MAGCCCGCAAAGGRGPRALTHVQKLRKPTFTVCCGKCGVSVVPTHMCRPHYDRPLDTVLLARAERQRGRCRQPESHHQPEPQERARRTSGRRPSRCIVARATATRARNRPAAPLQRPAPAARSAPPVRLRRPACPAAPPPSPRARRRAWRPAGCAAARRGRRYLWRSRGKKLPWGCAVRPPAPAQSSCCGGADVCRLSATSMVTSELVIDP